MSDFLADNNLCGQTLLSIVSTGNAIIAKLFILRESLPPIFRLESRADVIKYGEIIVDLRYFSEAEGFENKIQQNPVLKDLDDEIRESYIDLLSEFYGCFENIYKYAIGLNKFVEDVQEGFYIQMTLEEILSDTEGKQLLVESLYLYGVILLLADYYFEGPVRERIMTSFYRYSGLQHSDTNVDDVCKLLRSTKKGPTYPQDYFSRVEPNFEFVQLVIGRLRSDDIYNLLGSYPLPEHRTTALSSQASMLVVILSFAPTILQNETATMREICDKFFNDNFVVSVYMGFSLNLIDYWEGFRAARSALEVCKSAIKTSGTKIKALLEELTKVLKEGVLVSENVLEKANKVIALLKSSNVTLRWMMLHTAPLNAEYSTKKSRQARDHILQETNFDVETTLTLLLYIAQLELHLKNLYTKLLKDKESNWLSFRKEAKERIDELAEVFSGNKPLTTVPTNPNLCQWLQTKSKQIDALDYQRLNFSGRKIIELIRAFNDMLEYHNLESQAQVRDWVKETTDCLHRMLRTGSINEDTLVTLQIIGDLGYAWGGLIDIYTPQMRELIQKDPSAVSKLRAVFLKLASAMDIPLMRLNQAKSSELVSVSSYYSSELVSYVQSVLQIIPESVFALLHEIIELQTNSVKELPTRLDKDKVKNFAQLDARQQVARLTHDMSVLTEGILMMKTTLVGIIRIDSQVLLERGIRKELLRQLILTVTGGLALSKATFESKLKQISGTIDGIRRSFEYIGDYVNSNGINIFQEELCRLLNFATEQESNGWRKVKILPFNSSYQSKEVPIHLPMSEDSLATTFLGKILSELLTLTDVKSTIYLNETSTWYDAKTQLPVITPETFKLLEGAIGIAGLVGVDKLLSFHCSSELQKVIKLCQTETSSNLDILSSFHNRIQHPATSQQISSYASYLSRFTRSIVPQILMRIGQIQLLRKRIQYQLQVSGSLSAKQMYCSLKVCNKLLCLSINNSKATTELTSEVPTYSEPFGMYDPLSKIYVTSKPIQYVSPLLALFTLQQIKKLQFSKSLSTLVSRKGSQGLDGTSFVVGVSTFLMQLHQEATLGFLASICHFINSYIIHLRNSTSLPKPDEDLGACFYFVKNFVHFHSRQECDKFVKLIIPCYDMIPTLVNLLK